MSSTRSLLAAWQPNSPFNTISADTRKPNGRFWSRRSMNGYQSPEASLFSLPPKTLPLSPSTNMSQAEEQTSGLRQSSFSSSTQPFAPLSDFSDRSFHHKFHQHHVSDGSTDSSPTTTISTIDDSSATEPSPGSSPESPPPTTFAVGMLRPRTADERGGAPFFELQKQPPPRKGRNLKNLAVVTARQPGQPPKAASTTSLALAPPPPNQDGLSGLSSPAFVKPPSPPKTKKRPSNLGLTLLTPGGGNKAPPQEIRLAIPPTPAFGRPILRHFQSSPSLPLFPHLGIPSGVRTRAQIPSALQTILSPTEQPKQADVPEEEEQNFDIPLSREEKPEAYPNGPITVYDPSIDLYLEPTAETCRQYDVVMNVASEVRNPFLRYEEPDPTAEGIRVDGGGGIQLAPKRQQLAVVKNGCGSCTHDSSPTTPKATPLNSNFSADAISLLAKDPEYIHIPWDHNSDIVPDLLRLVKVIDDKVKQGKRILIHCQCGVSRSASLVVAYGLYKDPSRSVQEAYDAVKSKSKWIGPNMNLIMQLQEFRTSLTRGGVLPSDRGNMSPITLSSAYREWRGPFSANPSDMRNGPLSAGAAPTSQPSGAASVPAISPGPSSAPSGLAWPDIGQPTTNASTGRARAASIVKPTTAYVDPSGHVVPVLNVVRPQIITPQLRTAQTMPSVPRLEDHEVPPTPTQSLSSPRSEHFSMIPLQPRKEVDPADDFGLMSPTSTEFSSSPFDRSALLASLGMGSVREHEEAPRRALSLRSRSNPKESASSGLHPTHSPRLRGKISSPSLREQQQLQSLQAKIEASLSHRPKTSTGTGLDPIDEALMSPRATEFTRNPFKLELSPPPLPQAPQSADQDPRSPAHTGVSPITRNILDVL